MEFLFECLTRQLTSEHSERVRYRVEHGKRNFISTSNHVLLCFSYKHNSPLLTRKVDSIKKIDNPRIQIIKYIGALKMKTCVESQQKQWA